MVKPTQGNINNQITDTRLSAIQRFRRLLKVDQKDITQVYIYALFNGLVYLSLPLGIQAIINLIQGGEVTASWVILVTFVIAGVTFTGVLQLLQLRIVENISQKIFSRASFEFSIRIPKINHSAFYHYYAPELTNRFFDTMTIQKGLPKLLIDFSLAAFQIIAGLIVLSLYHNFFILFSIILIGLIYLIISVTGPAGLKTSLAESEFKYKIAFWLEEIARTKLSFKLMDTSRFNLQKTNENVENYLNAREKHFKILLQQFWYLIGFKTIIAAGLLITGSILVFNGEMNIGQFVAAEIIIILIIASVEKLIKSLDTIYDVLTALEKIGYVTDMPLDSDDGLPIADQKFLSIETHNISYRYPNNNEKTLTDVSLKLPTGKSAFIDGPSGSGKSTLLHILAGVISPDQGVLKYADLPYNSIDKHDLKAQIGVLLNDNDIFHGTILENIQMGRKSATPQNINQALQITRLNDFISTLPDGLNTVLDPEGTRIPRSIKEKLLLARAIAVPVKLLILEDPLKHVAALDKEEIIKDLSNHSRSWRVIVASVDKTWQKFIDNTIYLDKGKVIESNL